MSRGIHEARGVSLVPGKLTLNKVADLAQPTDSTEPKRLLARIAARTDVGLRREHNEDSFLVWDFAAGGPVPSDGISILDVSGAGALLVVSDGMGGAAAGEVASAVVVETLSERAAAFDTTAAAPEEIEEWLKEGVRESNHRTLSRARDNPDLEGMGATLTAVLVAESSMVIAHVGDSRAYLLRGGEMRQITVDQSVVGKLVAMGRITEDEARRHEHRNILLGAIGTDPEPEIDGGTAPVGSGDRLLLCSDGLTDLLEDQEIRAILAGGEEPDEQCAAFVRAANGRGGVDNITVVVAHLL